MVTYYNYNLPRKNIPHYMSGIGAVEALIFLCIKNSIESFDMDYR